MKLRKASRRQDQLVFWGLGLIGLLFFAPYLFASPTPMVYPVSDLGTDLPREVIPLWMYIKETITISGELPLWRPYSASGAPIVGHPVAPIIYPLHWMSVGLPLVLGLNLNAFLHFWWLGLGTYLVFRKLERIPWEAAAAGAVIFSFAPKWVAHLSGGHWPMLVAIAWWPWAWYGFRQFWKTGQLRWMILLGIALAAQAVNHGSYLALSWAVLGIATILQLDKGWKTWLQRTVYGWGTTGLVLAGLSAGQILPFLELLPYSNRIGLTLNEITFGSLPPTLLFGLVYLPELRFPEWFIYPGVTGLVLVCYGWSTGWSRRERWWGAGFFVSLLLSLGAFTPVYGWLLRMIPGFRLLRVPARWWIFALFFLAYLASWGFGRWITGVPVQKRRLFGSFGFLLALSLGGGVIKLINPALFPFNALPSALFMAAIVSLLLLRLVNTGRAFILLLVVGESFWAATTLIRPQVLENLPEDKRLAAYLAESTAAGARSFSPYRSLFTPRLVENGLFAADGYDSFLLEDYAAYVLKMIGCGFSGYAVSVPPTQSSPAALEACPVLALDTSLTHLLNIEKLILPESTSFPGAAPAFSVGGSQVYDIGPGQGRAFGAASWRTTKSDSCLEELPRLDTRTTALIEADLPVSLSSTPLTVLSTQIAPNRETFLVLVEEPGLLVRAVPWAPGWQVWVDGSPREVLRADCALQGVWLEKGDRLVEFVYAPRGWSIGFPISVGTAVSLLVLGLWMWIRPMTEKRSDSLESLP